MNLSPLERRIDGLVLRVAKLEDELGDAGLPASAAVPIDLRISAAGQLYHDSMTMTSDDGLVYRAMLTGRPPTWMFLPIPTVADIRGDFATVAALRAAVSSVAALRTWGF